MVEKNSGDDKERKIKVIDKSSKNLRDAYKKLSKYCYDKDGIFILERFYELWTGEFVNEEGIVHMMGEEEKISSQEKSVMAVVFSNARHFRFNDGKIKGQTDDALPDILASLQGQNRDSLKRTLSSIEKQAICSTRVIQKAATPSSLVAMQEETGVVALKPQANVANVSNS